MSASPLVLLSDFGTKERFVASMKGVAFSVYRDIPLFDLTHEIDPYNIREAAYTLAHTLKYWPEGTVFVAVVDPGVGTERPSVVAETNNGHFIVCPENGLLGEVKRLFGIKEIRRIDENKHRLPGSTFSYTFDGRDLYVYTGARMAAGIISLKDVGKVYKKPITSLEFSTAKQKGHVIYGIVTKVEEPYGNIVTNIPTEMVDKNGLKFGQKITARIHQNSNLSFEKALDYVRSFGFIPAGEPLIYPDSNHHIGLAVNGASFASMYDIHTDQQYEINLILKNPKKKK